MRFLRKAARSPRALGILPAAFHPPTAAHFALAQSALDSGETDEVALVLPESFPHKEYEHPGLPDRLRLLLAASSHDERLSVATAEGGLFLAIARECRVAYGESVRLRFLCGRDAAERILNWDYADTTPIEEQLAEYELLVAPRSGSLVPPAHLAEVVRYLPLSGFDDVSSTEVRQRIKLGQEWAHLVPEVIRDEVERLYS